MRVSVDTTGRFLNGLLEAVEEEVADAEVVLLLVVAVVVKSSAMAACNALVVDGGEQADDACPDSSDDGVTTRRNMLCLLPLLLLLLLLPWPIERSLVGCAAAIGAIDRGDMPWFVLWLWLRLCLVLCGWICRCCCCCCWYRCQRLRTASSSIAPLSLLSPTPPLADAEPQQSCHTTKEVRSCNSGGTVWECWRRSASQRVSSWASS